MKDYIYINNIHTAYFWKENSRFVVGFKTFIE